MRDTSHNQHQMIKSDIPSKNRGKKRLKTNDTTAETNQGMNHPSYLSLTSDTSQ